MIVVDGSSNRWPRSLDGEDSLLSVTLDERSGRRIEEDGLDSEEGESSCSGLGLSSSGERTVRSSSATCKRNKE